MAGITAYTGLSGSGKSYNVVEHVLLGALKKNQQVFINIPLRLEALEVDGYDTSLITQYTHSDILSDARWLLDVLPKGALLIVDECQMVWPSGTKATSIPDPIKEFFTQYRHRVSEDGHTTEIVLVTQDLANVANYVRSLIGKTFRHVKLDSMGMQRFNVGIYEGPAVGPNPPRAQRNMKTGPHKYKPEIYKYYISSTASDAGDVGDESRADSRGSIFKSPLWKWGFYAFIAALFIAWYSLRSAKEKMVPDLETASVEEGGQFVPTKFEVAPPKKPVPFEDHDVFIISNIGVFPSVQYKFLIRDRETRVTLDLQQLRRIGFSITPIDPCLVSMVFNDEERFVMCELPSDEQRTKSFFMSS